MTNDLHPTVRPSAPPVVPTPSLALRGTQVLGAVHGLAGLAAIGYAVVMFVAYGDSGPDDTFAGLLVVFGAGFVVLGAVLVVLALGTVLARRPTVSHACGLAAGLFLLASAGGCGFLFLPAGGAPVVVLSFVLLVALPFALVVCAVVGLVRGEDS